MKERGLDPLSVDVSALCKQGAELHGRWPLAGLQRLAESLGAATDASVAWAVQGSVVPVAGAEAEVWLALNASAEVPLLCQRCLQPFNEGLVVDRRFRFVRHEEEAARLDEESEDDVLVLPARMNLRELVEDELILALPIVPRHALCPSPLPLPADSPGADEPAANPFAALAALRGRPPGGVS
jgi:uncharacterized protein